MPNGKKIQSNSGCKRVYFRNDIWSLLLCFRHCKCFSLYQPVTGSNPSFLASVHWTSGHGVPVVNKSLVFSNGSADGRYSSLPPKWIPMAPCYHISCWYLLLFSKTALYYNLTLITFKELYLFSSLLGPFPTINAMKCMWWCHCFTSAND